MQWKDCLSGTWAVSGHNWAFCQTQSEVERLMQDGVGILQCDFQKRLPKMHWEVHQVHRQSYIMMGNLVMMMLC